MEKGESYRSFAPREENVISMSWQCLEEGVVVWVDKCWQRLHIGARGFTISKLDCVRVLGCCRIMKQTDPFTKLYLNMLGASQCIVRSSYQQEWL